MNLTRRQLLSAGAACAVASPSLAFGQETYPNKAIQFIVPFAAAGGNDVMARAIAPALGEQLGQQVLVENKPGAGGNIGSQFVARAAPDGYTMLLATNTLTLNPFLLKNLPFDVTKDFAPVARVANQPIVIVVNPALKVRNIKELVSYLKAHPGQVSYASPGNGTPHHFAAEMFKLVSGVQMVHIPYKGASPALTDLIAGRVQVMFASIISALPFIRDGRLRALATAEGHRLSVLKDVPTVKESGYPSYEATIWGGIFVPSKTPAVVTAKLAEAVLAVVAMPEVAERLQKSGFELSPGGPEEFRRRVVADLDQWGKVAHAIGLTPE